MKNKNLDKIHPNEKVGGIFCPIILTTNTQMTNTLSDNTQNNIQLANGNTLSNIEFKTYYDNACETVIKKYKLDSSETEIFYKGLDRTKGRGINFGEDPEHPSWFGSSNKKIDHRNLSDSYCATIIYLNTKIIDNNVLFFSTLFHELDHYAYFIKKFSNKLSNTPNEQKETIIQEIIQEDKEHYTKFSTEILARIDTANELLKKRVPYNMVHYYGIGNEYGITGDANYIDSIKYARKFFIFQEGLYNLLGKTFGLDGRKPINQQLPETAKKEFERILNGLRTTVFNSKSINNTKNIIDMFYNLLRNSTSWQEFNSKIRR